MEFLLWSLLGIPLAGAALCWLPLTFRGIMGVAMTAVVCHATATGLLVSCVLDGGQSLSSFSLLYADPLSAYHLLIMSAVFVFATVFCFTYFREAAASGKMKPERIRLFASLWQCSLAAMTLVLISNNIGIMWVGIELTTLLTAFLINIQTSKTSLEAMWKYLIICSVGVGFAFIGTIFVASSANGVGLDQDSLLLWSSLYQKAGMLNPVLVKTGFIFLLVGYGTKAGIAPMHSWLPDAHSQAPGPVSAIFSGFMLNAALYCIMRYLPISEAAAPGWAQSLLVFFGLLSIVVAAVFIRTQKDVKRMLAYSSVEHIGIVTLGLGLGGAGVLAALFHAFNHSMAKTLAFLSAGRMTQLYRTNEISSIRDALRGAPLWGMAFFIALLTLSGAAPFPIFLSEFQVLRAALDSGSYIVAVVFLVGLAIVFMGLMRQAIPMMIGGEDRRPENEAVSPSDIFIVSAAVLLLLSAALWMPDWFRDLIKAAASVCGGAQ